MPTRSDPILLFGGTFDPPHRAHVELVMRAADQLRAGRIVLIPAAVSPHKLDTPPTPGHHRATMLAHAFHDLPNVEISSLELDRPGPSYFIDTLEQLRATFEPEVTVFFLIGADQALAFQRWKRWEDILDLAIPAVLLRPPLTADAFRARIQAGYAPATAARWLDHLITAPLIDLSATELRLALAAGDAPADLDPRVLEYIRDHDLYRDV